MATVDALKKALVESLETKGVMGKLKAQVRTEVYKAMDDPSVEKPKLSNENLLINELIREYLQFNRYKYSDSVLVAETGQPEVQLDRKFLCKELNVEDTEETIQIPLLYSVLEAFVKQNRIGNSQRTGLCRNTPDS
ncbi:centrosomal protein 20-like [Ciona intestinalis]|uniref:lisH domain-containing protein FOPNL-like n=1 Tax=Ciona intestinalis TaxID=7719 RepID=UPI0002B8DC18|nr:lisH domain-containing protein FOPNL-like [Ciona intestinalis]|eukprot:XP_004225990.1 lisH domain-containing protein FOPNL-like [Ciona intestinalis]